MPNSTSGSGSYILVNGLRLNITTSKVRKASRLVENSNSGYSSTNYDPVIPDNSMMISIPWDYTNIPDTGAGLTPGTKVTIVQQMGSNEVQGIKTQTLTNCTVEYAEDNIDNEKDIIRTDVSVKGGVITAAA